MSAKNNAWLEIQRKDRQMASEHECGGTISHGGGGTSEEHVYCTRCKAFRYGPGATTTVPSGTDEAANQAAWDDGEDESPEADLVFSVFDDPGHVELWGWCRNTPVASVEDAQRKLDAHAAKCMAADGYAPGACIYALVWDNTDTIVAELVSEVAS